MKPLNGTVSYRKRNQRRLYKEKSYLGSTSDLSVASSSYSHSANQSRPLIVHSAKVQTPQRYYSKSIPYRDAGETPSRPKNNLKLFPVYTYTVEENQSQEARKMDLGDDRKNR